MNRRLAAFSAAFACLLVAATAGCDSRDTATRSTTTREETAQRLPNLPPGFKPYANRSVGYALGMAPGWKARDVRGGVTMIRSPDHLASIRLTADRTSEALELPVREFATQALESLEGYDDLKTSKARPFKGTPLDAAQATGHGVAKPGGIDTSLRLVVLRRPKIVNYTAVVATNAERAPLYDQALALRMLQTLRGRPVSVAVSP